MLTTLVSSVLHLFVANLWLLLLLTSIALIYRYSTRNFDHWKRRGIAGPAAFPFIGNFFSVTKPIPVLYREYLDKYGKFFGGYRGNRPVLFISDPGTIKRIMVRDFHLFRNRITQAPRSRLSGLNLVVSRDEQWKRIRSILSPMFTSAKLRKMEPQMSECIRSMLDSFERAVTDSPNGGGATVVARDAMGNFTMDVIAKCAFGTDTNAHVEGGDNVFVRNARDLMNFRLAPFLLGAFLPGVIYRTLRRLKVPMFHSAPSDFFYRLSAHLIKQRKLQGTSMEHEDMLQLMINAELNEASDNAIYDKQDLLEAHHVNIGAEELQKERDELKTILGSKYLSEDEIVAQSMVFFLAGYETTASTLSFALFELAVNQTIQQKLYDELQRAKQIDVKLSYQTVQNMPYLDAVLCETLRKYPPALAIGRECNADQYPIPECSENFVLSKGDAVQFPVYAIHHCAEFYPEPAKFNPDRFMPENRHKIIPYTYLPFGGGPRNCIGMRFALTEAKLGLAHLIDRFLVYQTERTPDQLKIVLSFPLLKTEPIYVGIKRR